MLQNVKIVGTKSKNNREYPIDVLRAARPLYENAHVYAGHDITAKQRNYRDRVGGIRNVSVRDTGLYADLHLNPKHTLCESIQYDFAHNSADVGLSHHVEADYRGNRVNKIVAVRSVDLVCSPATTCTLREEVEQQAAQEASEIESIKKTLSEALDSFKSLTEANNKMVAEIAELKARKPVSYNPLATAPTQEPFNVAAWAAKMKRK